MDIATEVLRPLFMHDTLYIVINSRWDDKIIFLAYQIQCVSKPT